MVSVDGTEDPPVDETLRVTPVHGADDLRCPPRHVFLRDPAIERARLEDVPEGAALGVLHDEAEVRRRLERTEEMRRPHRRGRARKQQDIAFELRGTLLAHDLLDT